MTHHWDEFSKSLAEPLPRRESLRRLGILVGGAVLSPLGLGTALARGPDPCKAFCNQCPKSQRSQCLAACNGCNKVTSRLCGSCGTYVCCGSGRTCCGGYCTDLADDVLNCGACGFVCDQPGPYEYGACIDGECRYACVEGAVDCNGGCTFIEWDPNNCGGCGNLCPESSPYCNYGVCSECSPGLTLCGGNCVDLSWDPGNCGACGNVCGGPNPSCYQGACSQGCVPSCPEGWCGGNGCGGVCACPSGMYCEYDGWCRQDCPTGTTNCSGYCTNLDYDWQNCGGCGVVCDTGNCILGYCRSADCTPDNPSYPNC